MSTTALVSIIISVGCILSALIRVVLKIIKTNNSDTITLVKGDKRITISKTPTDDDRRKLAHF